MNDSKNPFKVGDKVKIKEDPYGILSKAGFRLNTVYTVKEIDSETCRMYLKETLGCLHYTHFKLYKEENHTMTSQQKTKRVPFTHELWERWKEKGGKVFFKPEGKQVLQLAYFPEADHRYRYLYLTTPGSCVAGTDVEYLSIEIPVKTKRIPFNPEVKNSKVFYGDTELIEWFQAKTGVVCGTHVVNNFGGEDTNLYHPNDLKMEIEEENA